jgi:hypothetical protein
VFCIGDQDEAQRRFGELPDELRLHFARAFAFAAGIGPDPGVYSGPVPDPPEEE